jgi:hypothetical protein
MPRVDEAMCQGLRREGLVIPFPQPSGECIDEYHRSEERERRVPACTSVVREYALSVGFDSLAQSTDSEFE